MEEKRIIEEMARLEGYDLYEGKAYLHMKTGPLIWCGDIPDYLNSHDACQRVLSHIRSTDLDKYFAVCDYLFLSIHDVGMTDDETRDYCINTSCQQLCEAILKAYGKWTEEN